MDRLLWVPYGATGPSSETWPPCDLPCRAGLQALSSQGHPCPHRAPCGPPCPAPNTPAPTEPAKSTNLSPWWRPRRSTATLADGPGTREPERHTRGCGLLQRNPAFPCDEFAFSPFHTCRHHTRVHSLPRRVAQMLRFTRENTDPTGACPDPGLSPTARCSPCTLSLPPAASGPHDRPRPSSPGDLPRPLAIRQQWTPGFLQEHMTRHGRRVTHDGDVGHVLHESDGLAGLELAVTVLSRGTNQGGLAPG